MSGERAKQTIGRMVQLSGRLHRRGWRRGARLIEGLVRLGFGASVPGRATIAPSVFFHHSGLGVVINPLSVIEERCEIGVHVVLGGRAPDIGAPHVEPGCILHAGAKLIGPIRIGRGSVIAANAVVLNDVPPGSRVAGVPAVVKRSGIDAAQYLRDAAPGDPS